MIRLGEKVVITVVLVTCQLTLAAVTSFALNLTLLEIGLLSSLLGLVCGPCYYFLWVRER